MPGCTIQLLRLEAMMPIYDVPASVLTLIGILVAALLSWRVISISRIERATTEKIQQAERRIDESLTRKEAHEFRPVRCGVSAT